MNEQIYTILQTAKDTISKTKDEAALREWQVRFLGRKSELNRLLKELKDLPEDQRKSLGSQANDAKQKLQELLSLKNEEIAEKSIDWSKEWVDVTLPGKSYPSGNIHVLTLVERKIHDIFSSMGFDVADGPEIETEFYNFDSLNIPKNHPARDMQDVYWFNEKNSQGNRLLPRSHTSAVQVRYMQNHTPPFRIIIPGRIFRNEATDASHEHTFNQFEALMVGKNINVGNFKFIAEEFFSLFFGRSISVRLRPSYFPFTEPSFEFDINCMVCEGKGCSTCKKTGWLEVGGAGMVHQAVFEFAGYNRNEYQGFAWGFGIERLAMMKYKIDDIRLFHSGDLRFSQQFNLS